MCGWLGSPGKDKTAWFHMCRLAYKTYAVSDWPSFLTGLQTMLYILACTKHREVLTMWKQKAGTAKFISDSCLRQAWVPNGESSWNSTKMNNTHIGNILCVSYVHWGQCYLTEKDTACILTIVLSSHSQHLDTYSYTWPWLMSSHLLLWQILKHFKVWQQCHSHWELKCCNPSVTQLI